MHRPHAHGELRWARWLVTHAHTQCSRTLALTLRFRLRRTLAHRIARRLSDTRRSLPPWRYGGTARVQRQQLAASHTAVSVPALQEWLPVEALPELVAALDTPLPPGADGAERPRSRRRVGE
jgi:hypothetical protein